MTNTQAIDLVLRSAKAWANGHEDCLAIHRAIEKLREILKLAKERKAP